MKIPADITITKPRAISRDELLGWLQECIDKHEAVKTAASQSAAKLYREACDLVVLQSNALPQLDEATRPAVAALITERLRANFEQMGKLLDGAQYAASQKYFLAAGLEGSSTEVAAEVSTLMEEDVDPGNLRKTVPRKK